MEKEDDGANDHLKKKEEEYNTYSKSPRDNIVTESMNPQSLDFIPTTSTPKPEYEPKSHKLSFFNHTKSHFATDFDWHKEDSLSLIKKSYQSPESSSSQMDKSDHSEGLSDTLSHKVDSILKGKCPNSDSNTAPVVLFKHHGTTEISVCESAEMKFDQVITVADQSDNVVFHGECSKSYTFSDSSSAIKSIINAHDFMLKNADMTFDSKTSDEEKNLSLTEILVVPEMAYHNVQPSSVPQRVVAKIDRSTYEIEPVSVIHIVEPPVYNSSILPTDTVSSAKSTQVVAVSDHKSIQINDEDDCHIFFSDLAFADERKAFLEGEKKFEFDVSKRSELPMSYGSREISLTSSNENEQIDHRASPLSIASTASSKRLEWDNGFDIGYDAPKLHPLIPKGNTSQTNNTTSHASLQSQNSFKDIQSSLHLTSSAVPSMISEDSAINSSSKTEQSTIYFEESKSSESVESSSDQTLTEFSIPAKNKFYNGSKKPDVYHSDTQNDVLVSGKASQTACVSEQSEQKIPPNSHTADSISSNAESVTENLDECEEISEYENVSGRDSDEISYFPLNIASSESLIGKKIFYSRSIPGVPFQYLESHMLPPRTFAEHDSVMRAEVFTQVKTFFETPILDHDGLECSDQTPHIRWYPLVPEQHMQDIKDVSTQTAASFLAKQSELTSSSDVLQNRQSISSEFGHTAAQFDVREIGEEQCSIANVHQTDSLHNVNEVTIDNFQGVSSEDSVEGDIGTPTYERMEGVGQCQTPPIIVVVTSPTSESPTVPSPDSQLSIEQPLVADAYQQETPYKLPLTDINSEPTDTTFKSHDALSSSQLQRHSHQSVATYEDAIHQFFASSKNRSSVQTGIDSQVVIQLISKYDHPQLSQSTENASQTAIPSLGSSVDHTTPEVSEDDVDIVIVDKGIQNTSVKTRSTSGSTVSSSREHRLTDQDLSNHKNVINSLEDFGENQSFSQRDMQSSAEIAPQAEFDQNSSFQTFSISNVVASVSLDKDSESSVELTEVKDTVIYTVPAFSSRKISHSSSKKVIESSSSGKVIKSLSERVKDKNKISVQSTSREKIVLQPSEVDKLIDLVRTKNRNNKNFLKSFQSEHFTPSRNSSKIDKETTFPPLHQHLSPNVRSKLEAVLADIMRNIDYLKFFIAQGEGDFHSNLCALRIELALSEVKEAYDLALNLLNRMHENGSAQAKNIVSEVHSFDYSASSTSLLSTEQNVAINEMHPSSLRADGEVDTFGAYSRSVHKMSRDREKQGSEIGIEEHVHSNESIVSDQCKRRAIDDILSKATKKMEQEKQMSLSEKDSEQRQSAMNSIRSSQSSASYADSASNVEKEFIPLASSTSYERRVPFTEIGMTLENIKLKQDSQLESRSETSEERRESKNHRLQILSSLEQIDLILNKAEKQETLLNHFKKRISKSTHDSARNESKIISRTPLSAKSLKRKIYSILLDSIEHSRLLNYFILISSKAELYSSLCSSKAYAALDKVYKVYEFGLDLFGSDEMAKLHIEEWDRRTLSLPTEIMFLDPDKMKAQVERVMNSNTEITESEKELLKKTYSVEAREDQSTDSSHSSLDLGQLRPILEHTTRLQSHVSSPRVKTDGPVCTSSQNRASFKPESTFQMSAAALSDIDLTSSVREISTGGFIKSLSKVHNDPDSPRSCDQFADPNTLYRSGSEESSRNKSAEIAIDQSSLTKVKGPNKISPNSIFSFRSSSAAEKDLREISSAPNLSCGLSLLASKKDVSKLSFKSGLSQDLPVSSSTSSLISELDLHRKTETLLQDSSTGTSTSLVLSEHDLHKKTSQTLLQDRSTNTSISLLALERSSEALVQDRSVNTSASLLALALDLHIKNAETVLQNQSTNTSASQQDQHRTSENLRRNHITNSLLAVQDDLSRRQRSSNLRKESAKLHPPHIKRSLSEVSLEHNKENTEFSSTEDKILENWVVFYGKKGNSHGSNDSLTVGPKPVSLQEAFSKWRPDFAEYSVARASRFDRNYDLNRRMNYWKSFTARKSTNISRNSRNDAGKRIQRPKSLDDVTPMIVKTYGEVKRWPDASLTKKKIEAKNQSLRRTARIRTKLYSDRLRARALNGQVDIGLHDRLVVD